MKTLFISELKVGQELENEPFLLQEVVDRKTRDGRPFLLGQMRDKTGQIPFVFWDVPDYIQQTVQAGSVMMVSGRTANYKDSLQLTVNDLNAQPQPQMADFLPSSKQSQADLIARLRAHIAQLGQPWQRLLTHLLLQEPFLSTFSSAPAARNMHHAYIGGLLEHSLSMADLGAHLATHYDYVNKDLLVSGALIHDMGKVHEYTIAESFAHTEDGRLVGHIVRAVVMLEKAAAELGNIPAADLQQLVHLVTSHHGTLEWGSPVPPKTIEAVLLHQVDLLDSRVQGFFDHLQADAGDAAWTMKSSYMFGTELRKPDDFPSK